MPRSLPGTNRERMAITLTIREARRASGLSQAEFAERLGVNRTAVANWENGHSLPPLIGYLRAVGLTEARQLQEER